MAVGQKCAVVAHDRGHASAMGAGIDGHALADKAVAAYLQRRRFTPVLEVLRLMADRGKGKDARPRADGGAPSNDGMAHQLDLVCQYHILADVTKGTDAHTLAEAGSVLDDRRGVDLTFWHHPDPGSWR